jgi:hypothetical protein
MDHTIEMTPAEQTHAIEVARGEPHVTRNYTFAFPGEHYYLAMNCRISSLNDIINYLISLKEEFLCHQS